ncbi:acyltransferase family protein [Brucella sp. LJL56]
MKTKRIEFANTLRGLAALCVVISHYFGVFWVNQAAVGDLIKAPPLDLSTINIPSFITPLQLHQFFNWGAFGVALFFLISGFVIPFSLKNGTRLGFCISRSVRILPTYAVGFTISILTIWASTSYFNITWPFTFSEVAIHYFPGLRDIVQSRNIDGIIWTLDIEMKFYIVCALIAPLLSKRSKLAFVAPLALAISGLFLARIMPEWANTRPQLYLSLSPLVFSAQYIVFMFAGTAIFYIHSGQLPERAGVLVALIMVSLFALMWALCPPVVPFALMWNYAFAFLLFLFAFTFPRLFSSNRITDFFASISYPLYVVHGVAGYALLRMLIVIGVPSTLALIIVTATAIAVAWLLHRFVEWPTQKWSAEIGKWASRKAVWENRNSPDVGGKEISPV